MRLFLVAHQYYDYDELENISRKEGESLEYLFSRFDHILFRFHKDDKLYGKELYEWFIYFLCLYNEQDQLRNDEPVISFLNELPLEMHVSQGTNPSFVFYPSCNFIDPDNVT